MAPYRERGVWDGWVADFCVKAAGTSLIIAALYYNFNLSAFHTGCFRLLMRICGMVKHMAMKVGITPVPGI
jgi:hypothetical protein